jgi:hypothetical protein
MRKIDAFAHISPRLYLERLERHLESAISSQQLRYYREGVFPSTMRRDHRNGAGNGEEHQGDLNKRPSLASALRQSRCQLSWGCRRPKLTAPVSGA